ncbi:hypothetical protein SNOG_04585 [Parastagonospora nodorum SN15]|uniref:Uncharacterized protein n=1 Tax=Phaeosphaeria nodorum (strain SN15 / ATCC MYA-4574 / FGSC 10173) TaxID=321614 RepID=Q0UUH9_PHANO|nr:hypothetical protein SNOG_04585 [Parastagonospora nodorum SN15]EAT88345.1 hypothetical protein SNOG_04585 [Parastagonospora nodorum SN15]
MAKTSQYDKRWLDTVQSGTALDLLFSVCPQSFETKYECLLTGHIWDIGWDGNARNQVKRVFGLLGVCRQISVEAMTLLTDISGEMRRIHPGKMTYNINTDGEHIRRLFQK